MKHSMSLPSVTLQLIGANLLIQSCTNSIPFLDIILLSLLHGSWTLTPSITSENSMEWLSIKLLASSGGQIAIHFPVVLFIIHILPVKVGPSYRQIMYMISNLPTPTNNILLSFARLSLTRCGIMGTARTRLPHNPMITPLMGKTLDTLKNCLHRCYTKPPIAIVLHCLDWKTRWTNAIRKNSFNKLHT